jgi:signal transduction histidine kinase
LRTPLAAIDLVVEGMADGVLPAAPDTYATLRGQTARLTRLADDLGQVSAAEEGRLGLELADVPLADLVLAARDAAASGFAAAGIDLHVGPVPDVTVPVDRARIGQVLDNLLRNARQHTGPPGEVRLEAGRDGHEVWIAVRDTGQGIAADDLPHIFERFYRGDHSHRRDEGGGTGVGLAISRAIATAHRGTLTATSGGPGAGAEFVLRLPMA